MGKKKRRKQEAAEVVTAERPTPERMRRGIWHEPKGMGKRERPVVDVGEDMIGRLHHAGVITHEQEQAARAWQKLRLAYLAEFPETGGFKSCLNGEVPGYDDGDGNPDVIEAYRDAEKRLGREAMRELIRVAEDNRPPGEVWLLRWALEALRK